MLYYLLLIPAVLSTAWIYFLSPALSYWWLLPILIGCFAAANLVYVLLMFVCSWFAGPNKMYTHISPFYHALTMALDGWILALCRVKIHVTGLEKVPTDTEYYLLRTAMRLYAEHDYKTDDETVAMIAKKIHRRPERVREMLRGGLQNMQFTDFYRTYEDEDGEEGAEDVTCDRSREPSALFFRDEQSADLYEVFHSLDYRERDMLSLHLGFCPECFATRDKDCKPLETWTYTDLMLRYGLSSPDTAEKACKRALEKMKAALLNSL